MDRTYTLHDKLDDVSGTKRCLTLAECGIFLLTKAAYRWLIVYDKTAPRQKLCSDGIVRRSYALYVIPQHGSKTRLAHCIARDYHDATRQLLEKAARFPWIGTPADRYAVRERGKL
jgi:hypothetical protein